LHGINLAEYPTRECLLKSCGVPEWAERYVDWDYLKETADYNSYYSYY
ncbi:TPA: toxin, partial [Enterococcus faecalis]|nr:toxin [Enterococcus faecalis]